MNQSILFSPFQLGQQTLPNRVCLSPMCQYSAIDGLVNDWHFTHYAAMAHGGCGMIVVEATAISPDGRITPGDLGLWEDSQIPGLARIASYVQEFGCIPAIQLGHAGRKASCQLPWLGGGSLGDAHGGWQCVAPVPDPFHPEDPPSHALEPDEIIELAHKFAAAAHRAYQAGFRVIELHMAHGYLLHQFLSPLVNTRQDTWGSDLAARLRFPVLAARLTREILPPDACVIARLSATDWVEGGWDVSQSVALSQELKTVGIELIDTSSGGIVPHAPIHPSPGYQTAFAAEIRAKAEIPTAAVGLITSPEQAENILASGEADLIFLGRELLRTPNWPIEAAKHFSAPLPCPRQYLRAW